MSGQDQETSVEQEELLPELPEETLGDLQTIEKTRQQQRLLLQK